MRVPDWPNGGCGAAFGRAFVTCLKCRRLGDCHILAHRFVHEPKSEQAGGRRLSRLPSLSRRRMVVPSDRRGGAAGIPANLGAAWHAYGRGAYRIAIDVRSDIAWDNGCFDQAPAARDVYGSEPSFADRLQGGKSKSRAGAQRRLLRRLCVVWCDIWAALRQLQGWISFRSARLRTGRKRRLAAFPGQKLYVVWAIRHAMDETSPSQSRIHAASV